MNTAGHEGVGPVIARHYNARKEGDLENREKSQIVILRNFNNCMKSITFNEVMKKFKDERRDFNSLIGLDLCCGKGGDIKKWENSKMIKHVVFVDIAEVSLMHCKQRYQEMQRFHEKKHTGGRGLFTAEFIHLDCTKDLISAKMKDSSMMFDLVSCQFAFHYCFESYAQAQQMLRNATENLVSGGYFIGTLPNADRIVKRRRQCGQAEFGNEVYKVRFECDEPYPVYGARYHFQLEDAVSCPEFLVHFHSLMNLSTSFGLTLESRCTFDDLYYSQIEKTDAKSLINGMGALECFPAPDGAKLHFEEKNYEHALNFLNERSYRSNYKVGTVSSVEWEAIRLYLAFRFRKI